MNLEELGKIITGHDSKFNDTIKYMEKISEYKQNDEINMHIIGIEDLRDDTVQKSLPIEKVLMNAKSHDGTYFVVPQVVE
jgi:aspartyl-tRNA(Asn)/glutamyl-tRNA(Gln) amidotransferase subunit C